MVVLFQVVFMVGLTGDSNIDSSVMKEDAMFQDIVRASYMDSYKNLSYKALTAMHWLKTYCTRPQHIVKLDDDMVVNPFVLVRYLDIRQKKKRADENRSSATKSKNIATHTKPKIIRSIDCHVYESSPVTRDNQSKWYVSEGEYPPNAYPPYCYGTAFIMDVEVVTLLLEASRRTTFLWVDDAYLTGVLREKLAIPLHNIGSTYELNNNLFLQTLLAGERMFLHNPVQDIKTFTFMWEALLDKEHQV